MSEARRQASGRFAGETKLPSIHMLGGGWVVAD